MLNATHAAAKHRVQATRSFVHLYTQLKVTKVRLAQELKESRQSIEMRNGTFSRDGGNALYRTLLSVEHGGMCVVHPSAEVTAYRCAAVGASELALCKQVARRDPWRKSVPAIFIFNKASRLRSVYFQESQKLVAIAAA